MYITDIPQPVILISIALYLLISIFFLIIKYTSFLLENLRMILLLLSDGKGRQICKQSGFNKAPVFKLRTSHTLFLLVSSGIPTISIYLRLEFCEFRTLSF